MKLSGAHWSSKYPGSFLLDLWVVGYRVLHPQQLLLLIHPLRGPYLEGPESSTLLEYYR